MEYLWGVGCWGYLGVALLISILLILGYLKKRTKFKWTKRATRVSLSYYGISLALVICCGMLFSQPFDIIALILVTLFSEILLFAINGVIAPFERAKNLGFSYRSTEVLRKNNLIKIVITGSFGKTTCKNVLTALLSEKYKVIATIGNYNTPIGLAKSVLDIPPAGFSESEKPLIFIAEAGARRMGDVDRICRLVVPTYGIITGVCAQHLDTFRSVERVKRAKQELANFIGENGTVIFNGDNPHTLEMSKEFKGKPIVVGTSSGNAVVRNLRVSILGTFFELCVNGEVIPLKTSLLGRHNAINIALCVALALELGVSKESIINVVSALKATPHRLEVIKSGGITILDDSYNANLIGVMEGLKIVATHVGRRVVYAQGVVECGIKKGEINRAIGREIGKIADVVMLSGENTKQMERGLREGAFSGKIYKFPTIMHAQDAFKNILKQGDILYIQNDIP